MDIIVKQKMLSEQMPLLKAHQFLSELDVALEKRLNMPAKPPPSN
jgi:hypothetical protein